MGWKISVTLAPCLKVKAACDWMVDRSVCFPSGAMVQSASFRQCRVIQEKQVILCECVKVSTST